MTSLNGMSGVESMEEPMDEVLRMFPERDGKARVARGAIGNTLWTITLNTSFGYVVATAEIGVSTYDCRCMEFRNPCEEYAAFAKRLFDDGMKLAQDFALKMEDWHEATTPRG